MSAPGGAATRAARDRLIVALDTPDLAAAEALVARLGGVASHFKVGSVLFTAAGPAAVEMIRKRGGRVFLDLKYHDIPATVAGAVEAAARLGVGLLTVHASGGVAMLRAAATAAQAAGSDRPADRGGDRPHEPRPGGAPSRAGRPGRRRGARGASGRPRARGAAATAWWPRPGRPRGCARSWAGTRVIVTPGIRPAGGAADDQARIATPAAAAQAGADYLVVGRPITGAADPAAAAAAILAELPA